MLSTNPSLHKSTPRLVYTGAKNGQLGSAVYENIPLPQHLPHQYFFAESGPAGPVLTTSDTFIDRYGRKTLDPSQPYFNHATAMLNVFLNQGRTTLAERLIPPTAKKAMLRLSVELIPTDMPAYQRHADGRFVYEVNSSTGMSERAIDTNGTPFVGWRVVLHVGTAPFASAGPEASEFGKAGGPVNYRTGEVTSSTDGTTALGMIGSAAQQSKIYAIADVEASWFGGSGNRLGLSIQALTEDSTPSINQTIYQNTKAMPYRLRVMELGDNTLIPTVQPALNGDDEIMMILKDNVVHPTEQTPLSFNQYFVKAYGDPAAVNSKAGKFGRAKVYSDNLATVLNLLINGDPDNADGPVRGEIDFVDEYLGAGGDIDYTDPQNRHMLNFLTGTDYKNIPAYSFDVTTSDDFGGVRFDEDTVIYASGGDDGLELDQYGHPDRLANLRLLDELVRERANNYGTVGANMLNIARYPCSAYWDSGFSVDTKYALMSITAKRKDVMVITGIHRVADFKPAVGQNDPEWDYVGELSESEKRSIASNLYSNAQMIPESIVDGTGASRIAIVRGDSAPYDPRVPYNLPFTFDVAFKVSRYMGSSSGNWDERYALEDPTVKVLEYVGDLADNNDLTESQQDRYWDVGSSYPLFWDTKSLFWPYLRTVHSEPSSPLTSLEFVAGTCTAVKEAYRVWAILVGSNLEEAQFIERSNQLISDALNATLRFASKFRITVDTEITQADRQRRYTWTTNISFASGDYKTVNHLKITAESSDFQNNQQG